MPAAEGCSDRCCRARSQPRRGASCPIRRNGVESLGTVFAFSAEPGRAALDGMPGQTSPYAAAVLRHFGAMNGEEFGTVMRMVAEEVYLKTWRQAAALGQREPAAAALFRRAAG